MALRRLLTSFFSFLSAALHIHARAYPSPSRAVSADGHLPVCSQARRALSHFLPLSTLTNSCAVRPRSGLGDYRTLRRHRRSSSTVRRPRPYPCSCPCPSSHPFHHDYPSLSAFSCHLFSVSSPAILSDFHFFLFSPCFQHVRDAARTAADRVSAPVALPRSRSFSDLNLT